MPSAKIDEYAPGVALLLRLQLGAWFAWSGWMKVFHTGLDEFTRAVGNYQLAGDPWDAVIAYTVPWVEMVAGVCLVAGLWRRGALLMLAGLVAAFAIGVGHAQANDLNIACGCTGNPDDEPMNYTLKFLEFGLYWLVIVLIWIFGTKGGGHIFGGTRLKLPG